MKLTNTIRDAFICSVMNDVPSVDYREQIRSAAVKAAVADMPPRIAAIWKDKDLARWVKTSKVSFEEVGGVCLPTSADDYSDEKRAFTNRIKAQIVDLCAKAAEQRKNRRELEHKIRGAAYAYTTRKALANAMPEFAKYLPEDEAAANRSLPVVANVVADFVKAGWPKTPPRNNV